MLENFFRTQVEQLLDRAGIAINGSAPWDMDVHDNRLFQRILTQGNLGLGEAYMEGWWDCRALDEFFFRILRAGINRNVVTPSLLLGALAGHLFNLQLPSRSLSVARKHYNLGNDLFRGMLDSNMNYSCGYWHNTADLQEAQEQKLKLIFNKLMLEPGMKVLDIGCGWGGAAKTAAEHYGVHVTGVTISTEQVKVARELCRNLPVTIRLLDYRDIDEQFDRIYSIGMFEHVGYKNYRTYFEVARRCLSDEGLFLLHTIGGNESVSSTDPWISRYIFPNSMIPSARQITSASEGLFVLEDWHVFSHDYYLTLKSWERNFEEHCNTARSGYPVHFRRMWRYYLLSCAGAFLARTLQLWQVLLSPKGLVGPVRIAREV
ncbi:MAG: cyclopropane fatty acyl phospholipid synthase [Prosthecochloris sp.]|nr:cyclopropane fatty acyl phospholipid synthase [Prosthecochloris sp.]